MGCTNSKVEDEGAVLRCWTRTQLVKRVVKCRNSFAAAHLSYVDALGGVGAAFRPLAESGFEDRVRLSSVNVIGRGSAAKVSAFPHSPPPPSSVASSAQTLNRSLSARNVSSSAGTHNQFDAGVHANDNVQNLPLGVGAHVQFDAAVYANERVHKAAGVHSQDDAAARVDERVQNLPLGIGRHTQFDTLAMDNMHPIRRTYAREHERSSSQEVRMNMVLSPPRETLSPPKAGLSTPTLTLSPPKKVTFPLKALAPPPKAMLSPPKLYLPPPDAKFDELDDANFDQPKHDLKLVEQKTKDQKREVELSEKRPQLDSPNMDQLSPEFADLDSPPSPQDANYGWDWFDLFQPPPMPIHLEEQRRYKHMRGEEESDQSVDDELSFLGDEELQLPIEKDKGLEMKDVVKQEDVKMETREVQVQELTEEPKGRKMQDVDVKIDDEMESRKHDQELIKDGHGKEEGHEKEKGHQEVRATSPCEPKNIFDAMREIKEEFSRALESGKDFSRMLEANKSHFNTVFWDSKGLSEHSMRLLRGLSWNNKLSSTAAPWSRLESSEDSTSEEHSMMGSNSSTFDRLYAWEKKLYDEVKALEKINIEFEKKRRLLRTLDAKDGSYEKVEKTRAATKALENQMMVSVQAMEVTSTSIRKVTEEEIYPQLLELCEGLKKTWKALCDCHRKQKDASSMTWIPEDLLGNSTCNFQQHELLQLETALRNWDETLGSVFTQQKEYIESVDDWLKLSFLKPDRESKKGSSVTNRPRIFHLCKAWRGALPKFDPRLAVEAIKKFEAIIHDVGRYHSEEPKNLGNQESLSRDLHTTAFPSYSENNHLEKLELKKRLLAERSNSTQQHPERYQQKESLIVTRESHVSYLQVLQNELPDLFQALSEFAGICFQSYEEILSKVKNAS